MSAIKIKLMFAFIPLCIVVMNLLFAWYLSSGLYILFILSEIVYIGFFINTDFMRLHYSTLKVFGINATILILIALITYNLPYQLTSFMWQSALVAMFMDIINMLVFNKILGKHLKKSFVSTFVASTIDALIMNGYFVYTKAITIDVYLLQLVPVRIAVVVLVYILLKYMKHRGIYKDREVI